ncbi:hypothetical protein TUM17386_33100 [Shewanella algae]|nr:hypothetical protein TUM17386_33100 [Shewanella algae]
MPAFLIQRFRPKLSLPHITAKGKLGAARESVTCALGKATVFHAAITVASPLKNLSWR